jgi:hypothetical protein
MSLLHLSKNRTGALCMTTVEKILPSGDKMKKTLCWISEMIQAHPEKTRVTGCD